MVSHLRDEEATHLVLVQEVEASLEFVVVKRASDVAQVGFEVQERAEIRVLEDARAERRAREARQPSNGRVQGDIGWRNELQGGHVRILLLSIYADKGQPPTCETLLFRASVPTSVNAYAARS
jgi:hypothetical protein